MIFLLLIITLSIFADDKPGNQPNAIATKIAPCHLKPLAGSLPVTYKKKGDTCTVQEVTVDSIGNPWFSLTVNGQSLWSPARWWTYVSEIDSEAFVDGKQSDEDRKRRLTILKQHHDWPRRIIRAVRLGQICLDMNSEQLIASWETPLQKSNAFTVGVGQHGIWIYKPAQGPLVVVQIQNDKIIGWTTK